MVIVFGGKAVIQLIADGIGHGDSGTQIISALARISPYGALAQRDADAQVRSARITAIGAAVAQACFKASGDRYLFERSEEHTSELQSLMRISYAVFCLKKKKRRKCKG